MGIYCEVMLFRPPDGVYRQGQVVSGMIKYAVNEPTEIQRITTSLKGYGEVIIKLRHTNNRRRRTYKSTEVYVDSDIVIQDTKVEVPIGGYEYRFSFNLPYNIPSSVNIHKFHGKYKIKCRIMYYIRIKFEQPGFFSFNKHFKKEITVVSGVTPRLLREPVDYEDTKKLLHILSCKSSLINIRTTIENSVILFGGKINLNYEVENISRVMIKSVEIKLIEVHTFKASGRAAIKTVKDVLHTDTKTASIKSGDTQRMPIQINVLPEIHSLEESNIVSREYIVRIIVQLPIPHINAEFDIPVQIGLLEVNTTENRLEHTDNVHFVDSPPSYWEAMGEMRNKDNDYESDNDP